MSSFAHVILCGRKKKKNIFKISTALFSLVYSTTLMSTSSLCLWVFHRGLFKNSEFVRWACSEIDIPLMPQIEVMARVGVKLSSPGIPNGQNGLSVISALTQDASYVSHASHAVRSPKSRVYSNVGQWRRGSFHANALSPCAEHLSDSNFHKWPCFMFYYKIFYFYLRVYICHAISPSLDSNVRQWRWGFFPCCPQEFCWAETSVQ